MLWKMLVGDVRRSKGVSITLTLLMTLASALVITGVSLVVQTMGAVDVLWKSASPPDVVQMYIGDLEANRAESEALKTWAAERSEVEDMHLMRTLPVPGAQMWLAGQSQADSVLEPAFVTSPERFDLLLDEHYNRVQPGPGEIAMPVIYQEQGTLKLGDTVTVQLAEGVKKDFVVTSFLRDAQMNPSLVTSKRMVVHPDDFAVVNQHLNNPEYFIEFKLAKGADRGAFQHAYRDAHLPNRGIVVDSTIFRLMNALSTLLVAALAIVIASLLVVVAALSVRFAFLAAIENDLKEIGVLKAIGAPSRAMKRLYLIKYAALAGVGTVVGLLLAIPMTHTSLKPVLLYLGTPPTNLWAPLLAAFIVPLLLIGLCWLLLRRMDRISAVQVLQEQMRASRSGRRFRLTRSRFLPVHQWTGLTAALRPANLLLLTVVALSTFLMILPTTLASTFADQRFATYVGIGAADVRIDIRDNTINPEKVTKDAESDPDVTNVVRLTSNRYDIKKADGWETIVVERGDHTVFPLSYTSGHAPTAPDEIALSYNQAQEINADLGHTITMRTPGGEKQLRVSGIYQDVTNGGRTAKAVFEDSAPAVWEVVYLQLASGVDVHAKTEQFTNTYPEAKVNNVSDVSQQIFGAASSQLGVIALLAAIAAVGLIFLVTTLFLILILAREHDDIASLRAIGATSRGLVGHYLTRFGTVGLAGIIVGVVLVNTLGNSLFKLGLGRMGAPAVELLPDMLLAWVLIPLVLALVIATAIVIPTRKIRGISHA